MGENNKNKEALWQIRVTKSLDDVLEYAIKKDTHSTKSDLIRNAVREKLERMGFKLTMEEIEMVQSRKESEKSNGEKGEELAESST